MVLIGDTKVPECITEMMHSGVVRAKLKGRVVRKINTDGADSAVLNDSDILISYEGCGCAGGLVTTVRGESVPRDDQPTQNARRTQKVYEDILGRAWKTVAFKWDGTTPYTTTEQAFNGRDQVIRTRQTDNTSAANPQAFQDVTMTFDGHGRMKTRRYPVEDAATNTAWIYNPDDSVQQVIDPRGAITNFTYGDPRGLTTQISYSAPSGPAIPAAPTVTFGHDALGNRTSMDTAGVSETTYSYDQLSRMTGETVGFDGLSSSYTIGYGYQLSGKLRSVTDPFGAVVNYNDDKRGRTNSITGSGFAGVSVYADNIKFRAFGALKKMTYGSSDGSVVSYEYNERLKPKNYEASSGVSGSGYVRQANYEYFADGRAKAVDNGLDGRFDQAYRFDHMGRLLSSSSGLVTNWEEEEVPAYSQFIGYNAFGDMTSRSASVWGGEPSSFTNTYVNGRKQGGNEIFDAAGNIIDKTTNALNYERWRFDAAGALRQYEKAYETNGGLHYKITNSLAQGLDGDGQYVKRHSVRDVVNAFPQNSFRTEELSYFVRSTVLGGRVLTEVDGSGAKVSTSVYAGEMEIAEQRAATGEVIWKHRDAVTGSINSIKQDGTPYWGGENDSDFNAEVEPFGGDIPTADPYAGGGDPENQPMPTRFKMNGSVFSAESGCMVNSAPVDCTQMTDLAQSWGLKFLGGQIWDTSVWKYTAYQLFDSESQTFIDRDMAGQKWKAFGEQRGFQIGGSLYVVYISFVAVPRTQEPKPYPLKDLIDATLKVIENAKGKCAELLGNNALSRFGEISKNIAYDSDGKYVGSAHGITEGENIYLNPWSYVFNEDRRTLYPESKNMHKSIKARNNSIRDYQKLVTKFAITNFEYAIAGLIHEFLHATGVFEQDFRKSLRADGTVEVDASQSIKNQKRVLEACFSSPDDR